VEWQVKASVIGEEGIAQSRIDPIVLDLSAYQTGASSGSDRPMESLSLNFSKIEFEYKPQKSQETGKTTGDVTLEWEIAGLSEDEVKGSSWSLGPASEGGPPVAYMKYELKM
jgi:hypothetical protein